MRTWLKLIVLAHRTKVFVFGRKRKFNFNKRIKQYNLKHPIRCDYITDEEVRRINANLDKSHPTPGFYKKYFK